MKKIKCCKYDFKIVGLKPKEREILLKSIIIEQVAWNISSLLLNNILQNTQTLQLFTMIIKTESIYKSIKND
jgi:hypothetical protein